MSWALSDFHFIRPWFLILAPLLVLTWFILKRRALSSGWEQYLPTETIRVLQLHGQRVTDSKRWCQWSIVAAAVLSCVAAAGPTWLKQPTPTLQNQSALVVLLDLSPSMLAQDLSPDRLTRAKYKLIDVLRTVKDGQIALVAYAGDAHTVSPLTDDPSTIEALLPALHPAIMPSRGSNTEAAVELAQQLLRDANISAGEVLLISDGVTPSAMRSIESNINGAISISVMGVGGSEPAPIPNQGGGFLRGSNGQIVMAQVNDTELKQFARKLGGRYARLSNTEADIQYLIQDKFDADTQSSQISNDTRFDSWVDMGHWLLLLVLPVVALSFRRGFIYCLPFMFVFLLTPSQRSMAQTEGHNDDKQAGFNWQTLFKTPDQRGAELLDQQQFEAAAQTFERDDWRAIAAYKGGAFDKAVSDLENSNDVTSLYNRGNALAMSGDLESAIESYAQVLALAPEHSDAAHNKDIIEKLLQQQDQQQQSDENQQSDKDNSKQQESEQQNSQDQDSERADSEQQQSDQQSSEQDNPESQQAEQQQSEQSESEQQQSAEQESDKQEAEQQTSEAEEQVEQKPAEAAESEYANPVIGEETEDKLSDSSEQWLRGIRDDPSGLLRRKFKHQSQQNQRTGRATDTSSNEERY